MQHMRRLEVESEVETTRRPLYVIVLASHNTYSVFASENNTANSRTAPASSPGHLIRHNRVMPGYSRASWRDRNDLRRREQLYIPGIYRARCRRLEVDNTDGLGD